MNVRIIAGLGIALLAGAGAFFLVLTMSPSESPVQIVQPSREETVRVLVSTRDILRGERLILDDTRWVAWPKKAVQPTFITDEMPEAREGLTTAVARSLIVTGEPLVEAKVVKAGNSGLMAAIIAPGMRAVTTRVSPETASGGFILPGDRVDVLTTGNRGGRTRVLFEDVRVLAVNTTYSESLEGAHIDGSNVTMQLTPDDAEVFLTARGQGSISLVLRSIFTPEGDVVASGKRSSDVTVIRYGRS
ncbi:MAG: Flp pilus assembly protein CpaB [Marinicaulis sp.]|nr:Flp pilus assembly protein CpaB [Marinicaulis sp.]